MSAQPDYESMHAPELRVVSYEEIAEMEDRIVRIAQMDPALVCETGEAPEILFRAAQLAIHNSSDWQVNVRWIGVMHRVIGPSHDY